MNKAFIFAHGWASNKHFWQNLQPLLSEDGNSYYLCDFGYFHHNSGNSIEDIYKFVEYHQNQNNKIIGIGHSLGFSKLLMMDFKLDYYLGLQTFVSFLGNDNSLARHFLKSYQTKFEINPFKSFVENYSGVNGSGRYFKNIILDIYNINFNNVITDFGLLKKNISDLENLFKKLETVNYHIVASKDDPIVLLEVVRENFSDSKITLVEESCHLLGLIKPDEVVQIMKNELKLI